MTIVLLILLVAALIGWFGEWRCTVHLRGTVEANERTIAALREIAGIDHA